MGLYRATVPWGFSGSWGLTALGADLFKAAIPAVRGLHPLQPEYFIWAFRGLLLAAWLSWVLLLAFGFRGILPTWTASRSLIVAVPMLLAVLAPPVLSGDVLGYTSKGRLLFLHHLNPYQSGRLALERAGDPSARFLSDVNRLPYGPLWTLVAAGFAAVGTIGGEFGEILAHKVWAALSLTAAAFAGARLAERREAGRGRLTLLAIGLNPLLLLEGPASGHNDFPMMACFMWGAVLYAEHKRRLGAFALGAAVAIKAVSLAVVPFLMLAEFRRRPIRAADAALALVLILAPALVLSVPFGGPMVLLRATANQAEGAPSVLVRMTGAILFLASLMYGWWLVRTQAGPAAWLVGWIPVAMVLVVILSRFWYPWYFTWALIPALTGWDERHRTLTVFVSAIGLFATWLYTVGP